ncbi:hypothetical protein E3E23_09130 [Thermococcus sp. CX2]|uniref:hypothetical protein n=1 Tax=Thermococcus sp. CX2 TaxID=163006 RepID=UPI00143983B5|nr:hypothetical protein [Thermococcus sp. CX2]NJE85983.1 hypothetical protein [Thermococcus sp. CX2]
MKRWTFVLPFIYFLFLFALAFMDFPRQINRQWMWIQIGGLIFMIVLGRYLDGSIPKGVLITIGAFTLLWLALAFLISIKKEYFILLGLIIELVVVILVERFLGKH